MFTSEQIEAIAKKHAAQSPHGYAKEAADPKWKPHDWVVMAMEEVAQEASMPDPLRISKAFAAISKVLSTLNVEEARRVLRGASIAYQAD